jgi:hypothetical protein
MTMIGRCCHCDEVSSSSSSSSSSSIELWNGIPCSEICDALPVRWTVSIPLDPNQGACPEEFVGEHIVHFDGTSGSLYSCGWSSHKRIAITPSCFAGGVCDVVETGLPILFNHVHLNIFIASSTRYFGVTYYFRDGGHTGPPNSFFGPFIWGEPITTPCLDGEHKKFLSGGLQGCGHFVDPGYVIVKAGP